MFKRFKRLILMTSIFILTFVSPAAAQIFKQSGPVFLTDLTYSASTDYYITTLDSNLLAGGSVYHRLFSDSGYTKETWSETINFDTNIDWAYAKYNCSAYVWDIFYDANGNEIGTLKFYPDQLVNSSCSSKFGGTNPGSTTTSSCTTCDLFNCPGWQNYMQELQDIKNAIPPVPNWQEVANIFNNTIAPQIKSDLQSILGNVDNPPPAPIPPSIPGLGKDLNDRGITPPTGDNAPGLKDSTFTENDIKGGAPVIKERGDDSGGFIINNPIDGLPTQKEFTDNLPIEGDAVIPGPPPELDNPSPTPSEKDNVAPQPDDGTNTAPTPEDSGGTAPIPDESGTAPIPNESGTAPLPNENGTAPLPGNLTDSFPMPGG